MNTISTISELLTLSGSQFRVYDIGRKIDKLSKDQFEKFELNQLPYPCPIQGHACLAIAFWQKKSEQPYLWFIKLPLDERGLLNQGARNHFIAIIIEALGADLNVDPTEKQEELLKSNPYNFTPPQYKLAFLNSEINFSLFKRTSQYFEKTKQYFCSEQSDVQQWHDIGVQGISDLVVQIKQDSVLEHAIFDKLPILPLEVLAPLTTALENISLNADSIVKLIDIYPTVDIETKPFILRSLASSTSHPYTGKFLKSLLEEAADDLSNDILITLAGRCWEVMIQPSNMTLFLEKLAKKDNIALFQAVFKDLVAIPALRQIIFACMRSTDRSTALAKSIGSLFN